MSNKIEGIAVPILTPINEVEEINHEQLAALTDYVAEGGVNAIFVNGTTGEFARFSQKSRQELVSTVAKAAKGRVAVLALDIEEALQSVTPFTSSITCA